MHNYVIFFFLYGLNCRQDLKEDKGVNVLKYFTLTVCIKPEFISHLCFDIFIQMLISVKYCSSLVKLGLVKWLGKWFARQLLILTKVRNRMCEDNVQVIILTNGSHLGVNFRCPNSPK